MSNPYFNTVSELAEGGYPFHLLPITSGALVTHFIKIKIIKRHILRAALG